MMNLFNLRIIYMGVVHLDGEGRVELKIVMQEYWFITTRLL
jgi:hypothetical protein